MRISTPADRCVRTRQCWSCNRSARLGICRKPARPSNTPALPSRSPSDHPTFPNFRDIATSSESVVQQGALFRTACPVSATDGQMRDLWQMGVTTMIDLRAPEEIKQFGEPDILKRARVWVYPRAGGGFFKRPMVLPASKQHGGPKGKNNTSRTESHPPQLGFEVHQLSLLDRNRYVKQLIRRIPPQAAVLSLVYQIWDMEASEDILIRCVNEGGIPMLYELMLLTSTAEIGAVIKVILNALERGDGVMFYCKAGKDRTGIVAALLLALAGATDDQIISDYVLSDPHGDMALGSVTQMEDVRKLDRAVFSRAPAEGMASTLAFLRETVYFVATHTRAAISRPYSLEYGWQLVSPCMRTLLYSCHDSRRLIMREYGSVERYLAACGVSPEEQERLKAQLAPDTPDT